MEMITQQIRRINPAKNISADFYQKASLVVVVLLLNACASLKSINPFENLSPENQEPKVSFIDTQSVIVETSTIDQVSPEVVVASYERLLQRGNPEIRKEALHRLADLTMRLAESKLGIDDIDAQPDVGKALKEASFAKAIALYETLLFEFPDYASVDEVKYQLARAHSLNSDPESSLAILDQIAVKHTQSLSYVESQFRRGEAYFTRGNYREAENAYSQVIAKGQNTDFYDKALYKRGWTFFKQSLFLEAEKDFFNLYERLISQVESGVSNNKLLQDLIIDTRRVISLAFYNQDGALSVKEYFETFGRESYEDQIYLSLAELYIEQERFQDAAETFSGFIQRNPVHIAAPDFHTRMIDVYRKGGFPSLILPAKESFVNNYGRNSEYWKKYSGKVIEDLKAPLKKHLNDVSKFYHAKAQKSKKQADFLVAAKWYREILATFNEPAIDSEYRYALAEALFDGKAFEQAATEFEIVAYQNPTSHYSRDAGYKALLAYQAVQHPKNANELEKYLPSIQSGLKFSETFATDPKAPEILARVAEQFLLINNVKGAIDASQRLLLLPAKPTLKQSERAQIIIANGLFDLGEYAKAEVAITQLLQSVKLTAKQRQEFRQRRVQAVYKLAEKAKEAQSYEQAIALFLKVKDLEPKSPVAINAHFDAAVLLLQLEKWDSAANLFESFRAQYPKNKLTETIPERLALIYENQKDWNKAAREYQNLANAQTDPTLKREGEWRVAELYEKAGNLSKAIATYKDYVWTYPEPYLLAQEGRYKLIELYQKTNDKTKESFWRQKIVEFYGKNSNQNNSRTAFMAAESKYRLSEPLFNQFKSIKLKLPLAPNLKKKRAAMKKALDAFNAVARYEVAQFTTASTHKVAQIYKILADDLMNSQRPKGLSEDELEEYGFLLEDQALPFEDKAIEFFEVNAARTANNIYNDAVKASIDALRKLKPAQFDKSERLEALNAVNF